MIVANLSGGVDSAYGIYLLLKEKQELLIHHCVLYNGLSHLRTEFETNATYKIMEWYSNQGFTGYEYIETAINLPKPTMEDRRLLDLESVMFLTGGIFRTNPGLTVLARFANADDQTQTTRENKHRKDALIRTARRNNIKMIFPIARFTKQQIRDEMPQDLLDLCHSCRKPDENGNICMDCHACKLNFGE